MPKAPGDRARADRARAAPVRATRRPQPQRAQTAALMPPRGAWIAAGVAIGLYGAYAAYRAYGAPGGSAEPEGGVQENEGFDSDPQGRGRQAEWPIQWGDSDGDEQESTDTAAGPEPTLFPSGAVEEVVEETTEEPMEEDVEPPAEEPEESVQRTTPTPPHAQSGLEEIVKIAQNSELVKTGKDFIRELQKLAVKRAKAHAVRSGAGAKAAASGAKAAASSAKAAASSLKAAVKEAAPAREKKRLADAEKYEILKFAAMENTPPLDEVRAAIASATTKGVDFKFKNAFAESDLNSLYAKISKDKKFTVYGKPGDALILQLAELVFLAGHPGTLCAILGKDAMYFLLNVYGAEIRNAAVPNEELFARGWYLYREILTSRC